MSFWSKLFGRAPVAPPAPAAPADPKAAFAAEVIALLRAMPGVTHVEHQAADFSLAVTAGESSSVIYLHNVFMETRDLGPQERAERIRRLTSFVGRKDAQVSWEEAETRLVPMLRTSSNFGNVPITDKVPLSRAAVPFLIECVGLDSDTAVAYVTDVDIAEWAVSEAEAFESARANFAHHVAADEDVASFDTAAPYPIWYVSRDDSYETSRLLLPGWLAGFAGRVQGRPVAIVPQRSVLVVGGDGDERCIRRLIETAAREYEASPRSISPALYTVDAAGAVVPLVLAASHPLAHEVALGHLKLAAIEYETQKDSLEKQPEDIFSASVTVIQRDDGSYRSQAMWIRGVLSLLPRTDAILVVEDTETAKTTAFLVAWADLLAVAVDCLAQEPKLDPPRWRTLRWPSEQQLQELRTRAKRE